MTSSGIEPATCRFVAQCLNRYATARPPTRVMYCVERTQTPVESQSCVCKAFTLRLILLTPRYLSKQVLVRATNKRLEQRKVLYTFTQYAKKKKASTLKIEEICSSEMSVSNYGTKSLCYNPEDHNVSLRSCDDTTSHNFNYTLRLGRIQAQADQAAAQGGRFEGAASKLSKLLITTTPFHSLTQRYSMNVDRNFN